MPTPKAFRERFRSAHRAIWSRQRAKARCSGVGPQKGTMKEGGGCAKALKECGRREGKKSVFGRKAMKIFHTTTCIITLISYMVILSYLQIK